MEISGEKNRVHLIWIIPFNVNIQESAVLIFLYEHVRQLQYLVITACLQLINFHKKQLGLTICTHRTVMGMLRFILNFGLKSYLFGLEILYDSDT